LDAGCGDGRFCYELRNEKVRLIGIDFSEKAIGFAKIINPHAQFIVSSLRNVCLGNRVDVIVCLEVIEHLVPEELNQVVDRFKKLLRKDGFLVISVPSINVPVERKHYQHFSEESLRKIFCDSFEIESITGMFDTKSYKSKIFKCLRDIELLLMSSKNTSLRILKPIRIMSRWYSKMVERYFCKRIKYCNQKKAASLLLVAKLVN
jgi:2-polyprenyl-3-methyl-5-hydroxy-6-metoxy-1,4-benzoquinol methylase